MSRHINLYGQANWDLHFSSYLEINKKKTLYKGESFMTTNLA